MYHSAPLDEDSALGQRYEADGIGRQARIRVRSLRERKAARTTAIERPALPLWRRPVAEFPASTLAMAHLRCSDQAPVDGVPSTHAARLICAA